MMSRTLKLRLLTAAVVLPLFLAAMFLLPRAWWQFVLVAPLLAAACEWARLGGFRRVQTALFLGALATGVALLWSIASQGASGGAYDALVTRVIYALSLAFWLVIAPCWLWLKLAVRNRFALAAAGMTALLPTWLALAQLQGSGLLLLLGVVWIADTAAYLAGWTCGRRKLAPAISPGKTWEGAAGALAAVTVYALVVHLAQIMKRDIYFLVAVFLAMTVISIVGDLFESWLKRCAGVKDSGTLLPGHGGMLDRIDGLMSAMPLAALIFSSPS